MKEDRKITWKCAGNLPELKECKTECELSEKIDVIMRDISEAIGEIVYQSDGKNYVIGLALHHIEIDEEQDSGDILN